MVEQWWILLRTDKITLFIWYSFYSMLIISATLDLRFYINLVTQHTIIQLCVLWELSPHNFKIE